MLRRRRWFIQCFISMLKWKRWVLFGCLEKKQNRVAKWPLPRLFEAIDAAQTSERHKEGHLIKRWRGGRDGNRCLLLIYKSSLEHNWQWQCSLNLILWEGVIGKEFILLWFGQGGNEQQIQSLSTILEGKFLLPLDKAKKISRQRQWGYKTHIQKHFPSSSHRKGKGKEIVCVLSPRHLLW